LAGDYLVYSYNLQLFAKDGEGGEKTEPATPKKLDKAREEGQGSKESGFEHGSFIACIIWMLKSVRRFFDEAGALVGKTTSNK